MRQTLLIALALLPTAVLATTPGELIAGYSTEAKKSEPTFQASAQRGEGLFRKQFAVNDKMPGCSSCHTDNPRQVGEHVVTGKRIQPLAPSVNPERFTDTGKVEKWFGRNCKEVIGRDCTPAEKADFITYLKGVR